ncbi:hypothetical protein [Azospirillum palustre]
MDNGWPALHDAANRFLCLYRPKKRKISKTKVFQRLGLFMGQSAD